MAKIYEHLRARAAQNQKNHAKVESCGSYKLFHFYIFAKYILGGP